MIWPRCDVLKILTSYPSGRNFGFDKLLSSSHLSPLTVLKVIELLNEAAPGVNGTGGLVFDGFNDLR